MENYDYIFIDSPPLLAVTDALIIGAQVDNTLLVTKAETTKKDDLAHVLDLLEKGNIKPLGIILNNFDQIKSKRYGYKYGYGYGEYSAYISTD